MKKTYFITVSKGEVTYNIEAETKEEALDIADEWYNERTLEVKGVRWYNQEATKERMFIFKHLAKSFRNLVSKIPDIKNDNNYRLLVKLTNKAILSPEKSEKDTYLVMIDFIREEWLFNMITELYDTLLDDWDPDKKKR